MVNLAGWLSGAQLKQLLLQCIQVVNIVPTIYKCQINGAIIIIIIKKFRVERIVKNGIVSFLHFTDKIKVFYNYGFYIYLLVSTSKRIII